MTFTVTRHPTYNKSKATSSLFLLKMIVKQEGTKSNAYLNKDQHRSPTNNGMNKKTIKQQQQNHRLRTDSSLSYRWAWDVGTYMHFTGAKSSSLILFLLMHNIFITRMKASLLMQYIMTEKSNQIKHEM